MAKRFTNKRLASLISKDRDKFIVSKTVLVRLIGEQAINFFTLNFRRQGFLDDSLSKWKPRKKTEKSKIGNRGVLIGKGSSDKLSRSIKKLVTKRDSVIIGSTKIYAGVHNYGLKSGSGKGFIMPERKFIGDSRALNKKISKLVRNHLIKVFS
jgi:phage virion morphogenesis protein